VPLSMKESERLFSRAVARTPGGVHSPVRAFKAVGGSPLFVARGEGCRIVDVDGNSFIDYVGSWGPLIAGHAHPEVVEAITRVAARGTSFGANHELELELAERVARHVPSIDKVRFVSSGTEATMSALRLARGFTGRAKIVKLDGCYHGHADCLLVAAGSGVATLGIPGSPGVPAGTVADTLVAPYNDLSALAAVFEAHGGEIAAVIVEPVAGNMGCVPPSPGYLEGLRRVTREAGTLLVFDEVMTGFRLALGGAQARFGISPDLTCLGKVIGGGLPVGAYGGRAEIMDHVAPVGSVYQAGTLSGNPVAMAAGLATLDILERAGTYEKLEQLGARLEQGLVRAGRETGVPLCLNRCGSMITAFFCEGPVIDFASARSSDTARFGRFFQAMLERGVYLPPAQFEAAFIGLAHDEQAIEATVAASRNALAACG
jgi:glutamate-1-semialdehyde 2,1-aminomutase